MKLYATLKNERGGKKSSGDDIRLIIELSHGNKYVGQLELYNIIDDNVEGYRVVYRKAGQSYNSKEVIDELERQKTKGN